MSRLFHILNLSLFLSFPFLAPYFWSSGYIWRWWVMKGYGNPAVVNDDWLAWYVQVCFYNKIKFFHIRRSRLRTWRSFYGIEVCLDYKPHSFPFHFYWSVWILPSWKWGWTTDRRVIDWIRCAGSPVPPLLKTPPHLTSYKPRTYYPTNLI